MCLNGQWAVPQNHWVGFARIKLWKRKKIHLCQNAAKTLFDCPLRSKWGPGTTSVNVNKCVTLVFIESWIDKFYKSHKFYKLSKLCWTGSGRVFVSSRRFVATSAKVERCKRRRRRLFEKRRYINDVASTTLSTAQRRRLPLLIAFKTNCINKSNMHKDILCLLVPRALRFKATKS